MTDASGRETAAFHTPAEADLQACTCGDELRERTFGNDTETCFRRRASGRGFGDGLRGRASGRGFREQTFGSATQGTALPDLFRPQKREFAEFRNIFTFAMK